MEGIRIKIYTEIAEITEGSGSGRRSGDRRQATGGRRQAAEGQPTEVRRRREGKSFLQDGIENLGKPIERRSRGES